MRTIKRAIAVYMVAVLGAIVINTGNAGADLQLPSSDLGTAVASRPDQPAKPAQPAKAKAEQPVVTAPPATPAPTPAVVQKKVKQVVAAPTSAKGSWEHPIPTAHGNQIGEASYYANPYNGCASRHAKRWSVITITNLENGKSATCKVNDYGPEAWTNRVVDLDDDVFARLASKRQGIIKRVRVTW